MEPILTNPDYLLESSLDNLRDICNNLSYRDLVNFTSASHRAMVACQDILAKKLQEECNKPISQKEIDAYNEQFEDDLLHGLFHNISYLRIIDDNNFEMYIGSYSKRGVVYRNSVNYTGISIERKYKNRLTTHDILDPRTVYNIYNNRISCVNQDGMYPRKMTMRYYDNLFRGPYASQTVDFLTAILYNAVGTNREYMAGLGGPGENYSMRNSLIFKISKIKEFLSKYPDGNYPYHGHIFKFSDA